MRPAIPDEVMLVKLGDTRRGIRTRIWLEGKRLIAAGFTHGGRYWRIVEDGAMVLRVAADGDLRVDGAVTSRPIINMTGRYVADLFGTGTHVQVEFFNAQKTIIVRPT